MHDQASGQTSGPDGRPATEVAHDPGRDRYTITVDGRQAGHAGYLTRGDALVLVHTEIDPAYQGQGLGGTLAAGALDDIRGRGLRVVPRCPFIAAFIEAHPDYADLVVEA